MDHDDIMLNIVTGSGQHPSNQRAEIEAKKMTKADMKRMKYSMKMKLNTNRLRAKGNKFLNTSPNREVHSPRPEAK